MSRVDSPDKRYLHSLRVENVDPKMSADEIKDDFSLFGDIGDFYWPTNLATLKPARYLFVRYTQRAAAENAIASMDGRSLGDNIISVKMANKQDSYFTLDTGFITNQEFDTPKIAENHFDSSLPEEHFQKRHKERLAQVDTVYGIRIDDLAIEISKEELERIFSDFGDISSIYYPMDLKSAVIKPKGFAFVRYVRKEQAERAIAEMNGADLGVGRRIRVSEAKSPTYFNLDETPWETEGMQYLRMMRWCQQPPNTPAKITTTDDDAHFS